MQEAFLLLVRQGVAPDNPVGWMYRVVRNRAINAARTRGRRRRREAATAARGEPWFERADGDRLDAAAATDALKHLPVRAARGDRRPAVGWAFLRGNLAHKRQFREHGLPLLPTRACGPARKARWVMSGAKNENENEDLKAFEAALGSLRPRTDRLDGRWRSLLAKEASLTAALPSPVGRGAGGEGCASPARPSVPVHSLRPFRSRHFARPPFGVAGGILDNDCRGGDSVGDARDPYRSADGQSREPARHGDARLAV